MSLPKVFIRKPVYQTAAGWVKQFPDGTVSEAFATSAQAEEATQKPAAKTVAKAEPKVEDKVTAKASTETAKNSVKTDATEA